VKEPGDDAESSCEDALDKEAVSVEAACNAVEGLLLET